MPSWSDVIKEHLSIIQRLYPKEMVQELSRESGIKFYSDGDNSVSSYQDVKKYLEAIGKCLGTLPKVNAKLLISKKAVELGLKIPLK